MTSFKQQEWKRNKDQNKQKRDQVRAWYREGNSIDLIALWLNEPVDLVKKLYLKGVIKDEEV